MLKFLIPIVIICSLGLPNIGVPQPLPGIEDTNKIKDNFKSFVIADLKKAKKVKKVIEDKKNEVKDFEVELYFFLDIIEKYCKEVIIECDKKNWSIGKIRATTYIISGAERAISEILAYCNIVIPTDI
mgnify:CR=1 FL=1